MIVDGAHGFVGSSRAQALSEIVQAAPKQVPVWLTQDSAMLMATIGAGTGHARVLLIGYDAQHQTRIRTDESGDGPSWESTPFTP